MTNLIIVNSKAVFVSTFLNLFDKKRNKLTSLFLIRLIMTIFGAIFINNKSIYNNLFLNLKKS